MPDYAAFGGRLRSALPISGLPVLAPGARPDWRLRIASGAPPADVGAPDAVLEDGGLRVRLFARGDGWRLAYDDTGTYDVSAAGEVTWHPVPGADPELVRADVLGRVLALALGTGGCLPLHASAVTLGGRGVAFLAAKEHGKSTLAATLTLAGARLVGDDMAVVDPGPPVRLRPGVPLLRLDAASAARLGAMGMRVARVSGSKQTVALDPRRVRRTPAPLAALYVLSTAGRNGVRRVSLSSTEGAMALLAHAKLGPLLAGPAAAAHLARSAAVAARVPVHRLEIAPGLDRLDEVVERILSWHPAGGPRPAEAPA